MEFLVKEKVKLSWYYSPQEMVETINKERKSNNLSLCLEDQVKSVIEFIKIGNEFLKIDKSAGSYYCMEEKKQVITFDVNPQYVELIKFQMQGLLSFVVEQLSKGNRIIFNDVTHQADFLEDYYKKEKFTEYLDDKFPEKEKASVKKLKI